MKRRLAGVLTLWLFAVIAVGCMHALHSPGWITLIDGEKGLENFTVTGSKANWRAVDGAIQADSSPEKLASILLSNQSFKDFELYVEFWASEETNSGIYIRATNRTLVNSASAYEAQIWDKSPNQPNSTGALSNVGSVPVPPIYKAGGRWNVYEIYAKGSQFTVKLNGTVTVHGQNDKFPAGGIGIQFNPNTGPIKVRKMLVKEL